MNGPFSRERPRVQLVPLPGGSWCERRVDLRGPSVRWKKEREKGVRVIAQREREEKRNKRGEERIRVGKSLIPR
jgi:hypothetical protein